MTSRSPRRPPADRVDRQADRRRARRARPPGHRRGRPARRRGHRPVHRPVPQGGDRHAGRRAAANARRAPPLPARARGAADRDPGLHRRAGQAHRRAAGADRRAPTPRPGSRTSTCRTSPSAGPRPRSPARTASSRWPTCCSSDPATDPRAAAEGYLSENVADVAAALDGARAILVERFAEDADLIGQLRERMWAQGSLIAKVREGKAEEGKKYSDYFDFAEPFGRLKAHRVLAMFRAEKEEILDLTLNPNDEGFDAIAGDQPVRLLRAADRRPLRHHGPRLARRQVADRHRPLGLAHPHPGPPRHRPADAAVAERRGGGGRRVRRQPAGPAAGRPGRPARHHGPRPGLPHRRQGRGHRPDRQARSRPTRSTRTSRRTSGTSRWRS